LGAAYRDDEGQILAATTWQTLGFGDPITAEAMTIYLQCYALMFAK
jgi:hypothetical protein